MKVTVNNFFKDEDKIKENLNKFVVNIINNKIRK